MGQDLSKYLVSFLFITLLSSCQRPEDRMVKLLEKNYANLYVNDETHKREVINKLKEYLKTHELNENNEKDISLILNQINDGHVLLKNNASKNPRKHSDLEFIPGTFFLKECSHSCIPKVEAGKYEILEVDKVPFAQWLEDKKINVYASTPWGRKFRTSRLLSSNKIANSFSIKFQDSKGKIYETLTRTDINDRPIRKCIDGKRLDKNTYYINIKTLWCDKENNELFTNYSKEWNNATSEITQTDKVIIDLRENNGGDDWEVMYTLNSFIKENIRIYKYQFLNINQPGKVSRLMHLLPFNFTLWGPVGEDYTLGPNPDRTFFKNQVNVLISPGCFSSCEGLAAAFKNQRRAKLFGSQTHGGAGEPRFFPIGNTDYTINLPTCIAWQGNGELFEGVGIAPDEIFEDKLELAGDGVLQTAIKK